ncbi:hypothetical protein F5Y18DRAFT_387791 [Xylariaceae sp. FL1019]|nr:hypothetical protein F5Y18DRAFT_387791 [Xylariaceae sp. FL1019]
MSPQRKHRRPNKSSVQRERSRREMYRKRSKSLHRKAKELHAFTGAEVVVMTKDRQSPIITDLRQSACDLNELIPYRLRDLNAPTSIEDNTICTTEGLDSLSSDAEASEVEKEPAEHDNPPGPLLFMQNQDEKGRSNSRPLDHENTTSRAQHQHSLPPYFAAVTESLKYMSAEKVARLCEVRRRLDVWKDL